MSTWLSNLAFGLATGAFYTLWIGSILGWRIVRKTILHEGTWHSPFMFAEDIDQIRKQEHPAQAAILCSVGRSARVSYLTHDGRRAVDDDVTLAHRCLDAGHMAPFEHVARPMTEKERDLFGTTRWVAAPRGIFGDETEWIARETTYFLGNFNGWVQARKTLHAEHDRFSVAQ